MRINVLGRVAIVLCGALSSATCIDGSGFPGVHETVVETRALDPGGAFTLQNVNGRATVATWSEPRVRIEAEKTASSEGRLRDLRIEIDGEGSRVDVRTRMPGGWLFGGGGGRVQYRITLPEGARVRVGTVNGNVEVTGVAGELRASTTNGSISVSIAQGAGGRIEARTVNGSIENDLPLESTQRATRRRLEGRFGKGSGSLQLSTVNGSIHLRKG